MGISYMARPRCRKYKGLPPNLYYDKSNDIYRYRRPDTGKFTNIGKDRAKAISAAKQLNSILMVGQDLIASVLGTNPTLSDFINNRFTQEILPEKQLSSNTLRDYNNKLEYIHKHLGERLIDEITVKNISDFLQQFPPTNSNRYRSLLCIIFKHAVAEGLCEASPAANTLNRKLVKQRTRLKLEAYQAIYNISEPWFKNALDIALLTLQRREDVSRMKFSDIKDGCLYVIQKKTEKHGAAAHIKIEIGPDLAEVIKRCRDDIVSPYIIHRKPDRSVASQKKEHYTQVTPDYLSKQFAAVRDQTGLFDNISTAEKPSLHEIRSLGIKLYEDAGYDAQNLAGHTDRKMTELYKKGHEIEWTPAKANLKI